MRRRREGKCESQSEVTAVLTELKTNAQTAYETASSNLGRLEEMSVIIVDELNTTLEETKVELTASEAAVQQYQVSASKCWLRLSSLALEGYAFRVFNTL